MKNLFELKNTVILVTGGYGYLGKSICLGLLDHGASVVVLARDEKKYNQAFSENKNLHFVVCDVSSTESVKKAYQEVKEKLGKIDVLVNNSFFGQGGEIDNMSDEAWSTTMDGTINSTHRCIREVLPYFRQQKRGKIINVSSMYGIVAPDFQVYEENKQYTNPPHYGAGKAAIVQVSKYFASLLGPEGILVNTVSPGPFPSIEVQKSKSFVDALSSKNALRRIGQPNELQGVFIFLASNASSYITGQNIQVDGGWTII